MEYLANKNYKPYMRLNKDVRDTEVFAIMKDENYNYAELANAISRLEVKDITGEKMNIFVEAYNKTVIDKETKARVNQTYYIFRHLSVYWGNPTFDTAVARTGAGRDIAQVYARFNGWFINADLITDVPGEHLQTFMSYNCKKDSMGRKTLTSAVICDYLMPIASGPTGQTFTVNKVYLRACNEQWRVYYPRLTETCMPPLVS